MIHTPTLNLVVGQRLTDYASVDITIQRVAQGGMGLVAFGPNQGNGGNWSALKTMRPELLRQSARIRDLFVREALTWVGLRPHLNLLNAYSVTVINDQPCLILTYAKYGNLRRLLKHDLPLLVRLTLAQHIAAGLRAIHTPDPELLRLQPLVHRDLKPENVLVHANGHAVIADFGLAKVVVDAAETDPQALTLLAATAEQGGAENQSDATRSRAYQTQRGIALGTLAYMAPEQWVDAATVGPPADLYAFGLLLSELFAGQHALLDLNTHHSEVEWRAVHASGTPRPLSAQAPELPADVEDLYRALLAKHPEERPTAGDALKVLGAAAATLGQAPYEVPDMYQLTVHSLAAWWQNWAAAYLRFGYYDEAHERIDRAYALDPHDYHILLNRGTILGKLGHLDEALASYSAAEAVLPPEDVHHRSIVLNQRGMHLRKAGRPAEAEMAYAQALALRPDYADCWLFRAENERLWSIAELGAGHKAEAREHVTCGLAHVAQAISLNPNDPRNYQCQEWLQQALAQVGG